MSENSGKLVQILGSVVDVAFEPGNLPETYEALTISREGKKDMVLEVQKQLPDNWVRCIAMESTDGLLRGLDVNI
ncbi:MAG TPA: hypothetical protein PKD55_04105 [Bellilinea sp.]|nr:hypothetical protein [Bellilinea sp.]